MRVAIVSGSSRGIGFGIVKYLSDKDYIVYVNGRDEKSVNKAVSIIGSNAKPLVSDMCTESGVSESLKAVYNAEKQIDLVVANIGSGKSLAGWDVPEKEYRRVFDINFFSAVSLCTESVKYMKESGGNIIVISSIAGCESLGAPVAYSAAKSALISFVKNFSNHTGSIGVRANCISPGNVMFEGSTWDDKIKADEKQTMEYIEKNVPLKRFATPEDIAKGVGFIVDSEFLNGANIIIDGGQVNKVL